jgi:thiol-disulfide isomerase/thioredoxin
MNTEKLPPKSVISQASSRRGWLMGAVAGVATIGGVGLALRSNPSSAALPVSELDLWQQSFAKLDGGSLLLSTLRGKPLLLNFWATWCPPCVEELPLISRFYSENKAKGWQVLGLAVDQMAPVKRFLVNSPVSFSVAMAGLPGIELSRSLGNLSGGLPFTVVLGSDGQVAHRKIGRVTSADLLSWTALK